jgi:hypothetical protein
METPIGGTGVLCKMGNQVRKANKQKASSCAADKKKRDSERIKLLDRENKGL